MKSVFLLIVAIICLNSCKSDDDLASIFIGEQYVFRELDCDSENFENICVIILEFNNSEEVSVLLPFEDIIYNLRYEIEDQTIQIFFSEFFVEGIDRFYFIESDDVLVEQGSGNRYIIE